MPVSLGNLWRLLFRTSAYEQDSHVHEALDEVARLGLRWAGLVGALSALLYVALSLVVLGRPPAWSFQRVALGDLALPTILVILAACVSVFAISHTRPGLRTCRLAMAASVLLAGGIVIFEGVFFSGQITSYVTLIYLVGVAAVPFRPWHVLALGVGLTSLTAGLGLPAADLMRLGGALPDAPQQVASMGVTTLLLTGVSAALYLRHRARFEAQAALERSQAFLRQTESLAQVGGWAVDLRSGTVRCTSQVHALFETPPDFEPSIDDVLAFFPPVARERLKGAFDRCRRHGMPYDVELPIVTQAGRERWVRALGRPARTSSSGEVVEIAGAVQDVTAQRQMRQALHAREALLAAITENVSEGIYRSSLAKGLVYANQAFAQMFGYETPEALLQAPAASLYADPEVRGELYHTLREDGELRGVEVRFRRRDGSTFVGQITTTSVRDETGSDVVIDGILTDITARKRREEQLQAAKEEAEAARQAAEAASRSKSLFLAGVAHDLSSPLSGIIGFADVLQQELPAPQAEQAALIERSGRRIEKMAGQLLELARMESCGTCFDLAPHDVRAVAEDVVQAARDEACHAGIDLTLDAPPAPAVALIEEEALRRVLDNLVRNAIKYGEAGDRVRVWVRPAAGDAAPAHGLQAPDGPGVTAGAPVRLDASTSVVLGVDDTGPGIAPAFLERLFEPFARNAPGTEGTGLGLAVSKELVVRMGGTIRVRSEEGTGTRFRVWLPGTAA